MPKTLLDKAKEFQPKNAGVQGEYTDEHIDLALAWAKDEIRHSQVSHALGRTRQNVQSLLSILLREAVRSGKLVTPKK